jgi:hypothetical protein
MTDVALIKDGAVTQTWRDTTASALTAQADALEISHDGTLVEFESEHPVCGMLWDGEALSLPPAPAPTLDDYEAAIQALIDATAREKNYADGVSLASYVASTVPAWAAEAAAFIGWRDAVWGYVYTQLAAVEAEERAQPTVAELLAELPAITWPE